MSRLADSGALETYFHDSLLILQSAVRDYRAGRRAFYRTAALQLRLLLCDTVRRHNRVEDISLLRRVQPACVLPPLNPEGQPRHGKFLPVDEWVLQPLDGQNGEVLTIHQFIRRVCDQDGGAHVDLKPKAGLSAYPHRAELIIRLAEVLINQLSEPGA